MVKKIVFVCTGNICRSAMAEGIAKSLTKESEFYQFSSLGTHALIDHCADKKAIEVCSEIGVDISTHRARQVTIKELVDADLILTMEKAHVEFINSIAPFVKGKCILISDYPTKKFFKREVADPYRKSEKLFRKSRDLIKQNLIRIVDYLE